MVSRISFQPLWLWLFGKDPTFFSGEPVTSLLWWAAPSAGVQGRERGISVTSWLIPIKTLFGALVLFKV